jgi:hypothetical protein
MLRDEIAQLKMQTKKRVYKPRQQKQVLDPIPQPIPQPAPLQPIINIHNPAPQVVEHKPNKLVDKMRDSLLRFD